VVSSSVYSAKFRVIRGEKTNRTETEPKAARKRTKNEPKRIAVDNQRSKVNQKRIKTEPIRARFRTNPT
jgi:hypothetical protein